MGDEGSTNGRPGPGRHRSGDGESARARAVGRQIRVIGLAIMLPFIMVVGPVVGYYIGLWIGRQFGLGGWVRFAGLGFGAVAAVQQFVRTIRRLLRELG